MTIIPRSIYGVRAALAIATSCSLALTSPQAAADDIETAGSALRLALPAAALALTYSEDDAPGRRPLFYSLGTTALATYALKYTIDDRGPDGDDHAFPSGHASIAFSAAEFMRRRYGWRYGAPAYATAAFVGWSRLEADEHDAGQVLAGAILGITASYLLTDPRGPMVHVSVGPRAGHVQAALRW